MAVGEESYNACNSALEEWAAVAESGKAESVKKAKNKLEKKNHLGELKRTEGGIPIWPSDKALNVLTFGDLKDLVRWILTESWSK